MYAKTLIIIGISVLFISCKDNTINLINSPPSGYKFIDVEPTWSPDGISIVYIHYDTSLAAAGIYFIDTNGTNRRILLNGYQSNPDWSPDGEWIAFSNSGQIYKVKINGDSLTQLTNQGSNFFPSWSPNGEWIAFDSNIDGRYFIWKMKKDGTEKTKIIYSDTVNIGVREPYWNSSKIVHLCYYSGSTGEPQICAMEENGANYQRITNNTMLKNLPKSSRDGLTIVFFVEESGSVFSVWTVNYNGTNLRKLTEGQGYTPAWSPDKEWIVYTDSSPDNGRLWLMKKDGSLKHQLTF